MARYINIDESVGIRYLEDWYQNSIDNTQHPIWTDEHIEELICDFIVIPKDTPTADVVEVKHGEWKWDKRFANYACSLCNNYDLRTPNYCSNCGAKMDVRRDI